METLGRFAPSPSGRLHLGNLFCALLAWLSARQKGGKILLRVEDLDTARCPLKYGAQTERDLQWLGLDWDIGPGKENGTGPYYQSRRTALYQAALEKLEDRGLVYPCFCTRAELHAASAPHREDGQTVYVLPVFNSGGDRGEAPDSCARSAAAGVGGGLGLHGRTHGPL